MSPQNSQRQEQEPTEAPKPEVRKRRSAWRIIQWFLIPLLLIAALGCGLTAGYVLLGKREFAEVLQWSTWKHVYDLVFAP
ncbi:DNA-directed RNA polymerase subunit beta [Paenibacillus tengchongensis]|uniref:DNA-directed RNA polymerase subunit beta n=1 Tax=Paenibacillus tengchongensis TaxID=2608684 RepID=UPI00124C7EFE|nr:DNA-directed RNA polymerase subunit beta [Paenibacillus tengchongensis]